MFGSLISAVDPVATLAAFSSVGVDPRVYSMIYGESILNDAVAIVFFSVFKQVSVDAEDGMQTAGTFFAVVFQLVWMSVGSLLCGILWGVLVCLVFKVHGAMPPPPEKENTITALASVATDAVYEDKTPQGNSRQTDEPDASEFQNPITFEAEAPSQSTQSPRTRAEEERQVDHKKHRGMADAAVFFLASISSFYFAEALHLSGIISALFCGIVCNQTAVRNMTFEGKLVAATVPSR